tara:strand:+ start:58 stop:549 length:492 start_codon:yes stop_codon:yes gene_type:complete
MIKKLLPFLFFCTPSSVLADLNHSIMSTVKLEALSAATSADRIGSSYSISGSGITTVDANDESTIGGFSTVTNGVPSLTTITASQSTSGDSFSFSQSYLEGDSTPTSAASVGEIPNFSDITSTSAASIGTAAIGLDNHSMTLTPGTGTGIVLTGQFVTDLTID